MGIAAVEEASSMLGSAGVFSCTSDEVRFSSSASKSSATYEGCWMGSSRLVQGNCTVEVASGWLAGSIGLEGSEKISIGSSLSIPKSQFSDPPSCSSTAAFELAVVDSAFRCKEGSDSVSADDSDDEAKLKDMTARWLVDEEGPIAVTSALEDNSFVPKSPTWDPRLRICESTASNAVSAFKLQFPRAEFQYESAEGFSPNEVQRLEDAGFRPCCEDDSGWREVEFFFLSRSLHLVLVVR